MTSPADVLTVTAATLASIAVTPASPSIGKGATQQFVATGTYSDNSTQNLITSTVTWSFGDDDDGDDHQWHDRRAGDGSGSRDAATSRRALERSDVAGRCAGR